MTTDDTSTNTGDISLPDGVKAVCWLHYGLSGLAVLVGVLFLFNNPLVGILAVLLGVFLFYIAQGLRSFDYTTWRNAITLHGFDIGLGLLLIPSHGVGENLISIVISSAVIIYLFFQRHRYRPDSG